MSNHKTKKYQINASGRNEGKGARGVWNIRNMVGSFGVTERRQIGEGKGKREGHGEGEGEVKREGHQDLVLFVHILLVLFIFHSFSLFFFISETQPRIYVHAPRVLHASCLQELLLAYLSLLKRQVCVLTCMILAHRYVMVHISYCSRVHSILVHYDTYQVISTGVASFLRGGGIRLCQGL